jgi:zinc transport system ATP-binding protein
VEYAVDIENASVFRAGELVLEDATLRVERGELLAVIGPNGGGKTTLLRLMLGLIQPRSGSIRVFGGDPAHMRRQIGYVPQFSTLRADVPATVRDIVMTGAAERGFFGARLPRDKQSRRLAETLLEEMGLLALAGKHPTSLSGGERQRLLVARALMGRPENNDDFLLLLDEPTASIDPKGKFCFYELVNGLRGRATIVVVSHDLLPAPPFFSRMVAVNRTVKILSGEEPTLEALTALFGPHLHSCPVGDLQHSAGLHHQMGCSHEACLGSDTGLETSIREN